MTPDPGCRSFDHADPTQRNGKIATIILNGIVNVEGICFFDDVIQDCSPTTVLLL
jgi:hypothetical protein